MDIIFTTEGRVLVVGFNRPDKKNALTSSMYTELADALKGADSDDNIRVVVIKGSPAIFSAGADLSDFQQNPPRNMEAPLYHFLAAISTFSKPIIAAVSGAAVGIGTTMLLHCDIVYASETARFSLPFVQLGLCPEAASSLLLPRVLGHQRAAEMLMLGESLMAADAVTLGLVNRVVALDSLDEFVSAQATKMASLPGVSLRLTKSLMKRGLVEATSQQIREEAEQFSALLTGPDAVEAFSAFLEKRRPVFK
jgi:enoyl-CoA hydratase/carnithine racemase